MRRGAGSRQKEEQPLWTSLEAVGEATGPASARGRRFSVHGISANSTSATHGAPSLPQRRVEVRRDLAVYIARIKVGNGSYTHNSIVRGILVKRGSQSHDNEGKVR